MTLGVVIPVYRGGGTIGGVVEALYRFSEARRLMCRVVLVEDMSGDGSREEVLKLAARYTGVTAVLPERNVGQQRALLMGLQQLEDCDMVATMDDDGAHPVELLDALMEGIRQGAELCYAVPVRKGYSPLRRTGSLFRDFLFSLLAGKPRGVRVSAFRVMTGDLALRLRAEPDGFIYLSAAAFAHRPRASFVTYEAKPEAASGYTFTKLLRLYAGLVLHYTPLKALHRMKAAADCPRAVLPGRGTLWQP